jgi:hypothetical protein
MPFARSPGDPDAATHLPRGIRAVRRVLAMRGRNLVAA